MFTVFLVFRQKKKIVIVSDHTCLLEDVAIIAIAASVFASCFFFLSVLDYQVLLEQQSICSIFLLEFFIVFGSCFKILQAFL